MIAAILLAGLTAFAGLTQTGVDDSTRVRGTVTGSGPESRPAADAWVVAASDSEVTRTRADAHGRYVFLTLLPGVYRMFAYPGSDNSDGPHVGAAIFTRAANGSATGAQRCMADAMSDVELFAGVEYLVNLDLVTDCR